jgi:Tfp pilus assembly protein PilX
MANSSMQRASLTKRRLPERGVALAIAAMALLLLTLLIVSAHYTMVSQTATTSSYRYTTQAFYVAQAGTQRAIDWFNSQYISPSWKSLSPALVDTSYPNSWNSAPVVLTSTGTGTNFPVSNTFQAYVNSENNLTLKSLPGVTGQYSVTATLLSVQLVDSQPVERWRIVTVGNLITPATNAQLASMENVAVIEKLTLGATISAVCADSLNFTGNVTTGSYNSASGAVNIQNSNGNVSTFKNSQGPISFKGSTQINGSLNLAPAI